MTVQDAIVFLKEFWAVVVVVVIKYFLFFVLSTPSPVSQIIPILISTYRYIHVFKKREIELFVCVCKCLCVFHNLHLKV